MKRIGILTAGGDTPALNATIHGAVARASQRRIEVFGFIKGFSGLFNPRVPHVLLNPLFTPIPELDVTRGGTLIGASRDYVDADDHEAIGQIVERLRRLQVEGLICVGGDGTLNGMQALSNHLPTVLAPKTIDNDLGLNYRHEVDEWVREPIETPPGYRYVPRPVPDPFRPGTHGQLRHAGLRHRRVRLRPGRRAHPHHRREPPPHRHHRGHGPTLRLPRPRRRLRPARPRSHPGKPR